MIYPSFVAFDLETTGLVDKKDEIIEIGAVKFTVRDDNGTIRPKQVATFQTLVKPPMMIPDEATKINHITNAMVENAPAIKDVLKKFTVFGTDDTNFRATVLIFNFIINILFTM